MPLTSVNYAKLAITPSDIYFIILDNESSTYILIVGLSYQHRKMHEIVETHKV